MKAIFLILIFAMLLPHTSFAQEASCDYRIEILADGNEFESQDFKWRMKATKIEGKPTNITGTAEIEDSSGKTVKSYKPWTSDSISKQKTSNEYSPNLKAGEYKITAEINVDCDDKDKGNNVDARSISIKGQQQTTAKPAKNTGIEDAKTKNAEASGSKAEKSISEKPAQNAPSKIENTGAENPNDNVVQLRGKTIQNNALQTTAAVVNSQDVVYESSNEKAKGWIMIFLLTLSILLNIILIWRR